MVHVPLVSPLDVAILQPIEFPVPDAPVLTCVIQPAGTVGGVVLFRLAEITIISPAWWLGIVIVVAWAEPDPIRLIAIGA